MQERDAGEEEEERGDLHDARCKCVCLCGFWFMEAPFVFPHENNALCAPRCILRFRRRIAGLKEENLAIAKEITRITGISIVRSS